MNELSANPAPLLNGGCLVAAGLSGLAGVALSAAAAHSAAADLLDPAARMLLFHAPAFLALAVLVPARGRGGGMVRRVLAVAGIALGLGLLLFCGDLCARTLLGHRLFAFAAPLGGTLLMSGWLAVLLAGAMRLAARRT
jgi:uncharacterized membrane protein YgdD (TMEM256/DUF423 family)